MLKKFYAKCIKSDSQGRLIVGQVYECEAWQGKTLIHGACIMDSKTFWEYFEPTKGVEMTNRQQHIEAGALAEYGSECRAMHHVIKGAEWADEHPSEQTLAKTVYLYKRWFYNDSGLNVMEFIKKNWNIEI